MPFSLEGKPRSMSDAKILDEEPAPLPGKRKSDAHEDNPSCKTLKTQPSRTSDDENHLNGKDGDDPERKEENGGGKAESLPENGEKGVEEDEEVRGCVMDEDGEDEDDEDYDEKKEREEGGEEVVDRKGKGKGKGIMAEWVVDDKGKGKSIISWDDYEFDSDISLDCEDDDSDSDDRDSDDTEELLGLGSDYLSDDPLAEVDLDNILPSRTRHGAAGIKGVVICGGDRKDAWDGDGDRNGDGNGCRNGDGSSGHIGDGNADCRGDVSADHTGDGDNKGL